ncbi:MAG: DUF1576 domain-containing protein, partial [Candidatus Hydrogenedentota bacterium]
MSQAKGERGKSFHQDNEATHMAVLMALPLLLIVTGLTVGLTMESVGDFLTGLKSILKSPSILLTDYLAVGGLGATLLNAGTCGLIGCLIMIVLRIEPSGPFIAAIYTVIGFAFFGKNLFNIWPIFIGVMLYARVEGTPFKNYALIALFGTTLAPLVSFITFGSWLTLSVGAPLGIALGVGAGFVLPPLASHMLQFHNGYNIYNIGFTGGMLGSFFIAILRGFRFDIEPERLLNDEFSEWLQICFGAVFVAFIAFGVWLSRSDMPALRLALANIYASSGRLVSDFTSIGNHAAAFVNMGIMGLAATAFTLLLGGAFDGPVIGGVLTMVGFSAFGKHLRNCLPILFGVFVASLFKSWDGGTTELVMSGLFGATLAPIAGHYGIVAGIVAGFCHLSVVMNVAVLHGGVNLYN